MFLTTRPHSSDVLFLPVVLPVLYLFSDTSFVPLATPPRPFQVYTRHLRTDFEPPIDSSLMAPSSTTLFLPSLDDLSLAIQKGTRSSCNPHNFYNFLTYYWLSSLYSTFIFTLSSISLLEIVHEALSHPVWKHAMIEEMVTLHSTITWDLVTLPADKSSVSCCWVYTAKIGLDGQVDHLKAHLVAKGVYSDIWLRLL